MTKSVLLLGAVCGLLLAACNGETGKRGSNQDPASTCETCGGSSAGGSDGGTGGTGGTDGTGLGGSGGTLEGSGGSGVAAAAGAGGEGGVGGNIGGSAGDAGTAGIGGATTGGAGGQAIALYQYEWPGTSTGGTGGSAGTGSGGGTGIDPNTLSIVFSSEFASHGYADVCANPWGDYSCGQWTVTIPIKPEQQYVGSVIDLFQTNAFYSMQGSPYPDGTCAAGGGSVEGKLTITAISSMVLEGELLVNDIGFSAPINGLFGARFCNSL